MAALERCLFLWLFFLLVICNSEESRAPQDVKFISQNFHSVLRWKPGNGTENTTLFFVQHQRFGQEWANKTECWGIRVTCCNLTRETIPLLELFFARVRSFSFNKFSNWTTSESFCPLTDTVIGPPETEVIPLEKSMLIKLTAPRTAFKKENGTLSVKDTYHEVKYHITLSVKAKDQIDLEPQRTYITKNETFEIQHLSPGTTYCISVRTEVSLNDNVGGLSREQCVTLAEPSARIVIVCSAGGALVLITLSIYLCFKYKYVFDPKLHYPAVLTTWNKKEQETVVFSLPIVEEPYIDKWELTELSKHPSALQFQYKCAAKAPCKKYINVEAPDSFKCKIFDPSSIPLDIMILCNYLETPTGSDYVEMVAELDTLLSLDQRHDNTRLSRELCQCQLCAQYEEKCQDQEEAQSKLLSSSPEYINQDICENPGPT